MRTTKRRKIQISKSSSTTSSSANNQDVKTRRRTVVRPVQEGVRTEKVKIEEPLLSLTQATSEQINNLQDANLQKTNTPVANSRDAHTQQRSIQVKEENLTETLKGVGITDISHLLPDPEDPNLYCKACKTTYSVKRTFREHCVKYHKMDLPLTPGLLQLDLLAKFPDIVPDPDDPDNNCCVCQRNFSYKSNFHRHLRTCHNMKINSSFSNQIKHPHIVPDEDDLNNRCAACEKSFAGAINYRSHLSAVHNMAVRPGQRAKKSNGILPEEDNPDCYCRVCDKTLESKRTYRSHLQKIHCMVLKPGDRAIRAKNSHLIPDKNDPNNYCKVCEKTYTRVSGFYNHLKSIHQMAFPERKRKRRIVVTEKSTIVPDEDDPNFFCCICEKTYSKNQLFRTHLRHVHHMILKPLPRPVPVRNNDILPDKDDPNYYCRACKKTFSARNIYRKHLQGYHKMNLVPLRRNKPVDTLSPTSTCVCSTCDRVCSRKHFKSHVCKGRVIEAPPKIIVTTNVKPDEDDPNFFCCVCQKNSLNKRTFNIHLKVAHNMNVRDISYSPPLLTGPLPDIYDPNHYCSLCEKKFPSADSYFFHLRGVHKMIFSILRKKKDSIPHPELTPDEFDPNFICIACEKKFSCNTGFRSHLRKIHDMTLSPPVKRSRRRFIHPEIIPDVDDPTFACGTCEKTFDVRHKYRSHLRNSHQMDFNNIREGKKLKEWIHPEIIPDVNDPNLYCATCEKTYVNKCKYRHHLRSSHKMVLEPLPRLRRKASSP